MHWLDGIFLALLALGGVLGARSGLLRQLARLGGFSAALYTTVIFHDPATAALQTHFMKDAEPALVSTVSYVMVFCVVYLDIFFSTLLIEQGVQALRLEALNRILGALLGTSQVALLLGTTYLILAGYPHEATKEFLSKSTLGPVLAHGVERALVVVPPEYREELHNGLEELKATIKAQTEATKTP